MARRAGYKAGYITHYSGPKAGGGRTNGVKLVVRGYYEIPRGATGYQKLTKISKPPPSATRPPPQRLHGRHLTRLPKSTQAGSAASCGSPDWARASAHPRRGAVTVRPQNQAFAIRAGTPWNARDPNHNAALPRAKPGWHRPCPCRGA